MKENLKRLFKMRDFAKTAFILAALSAVFGAVLTLLTPLMVGRAIDCLIGRRVDFERLTHYGKVLLSLYIGAAFFQWTLAQASNHIGYKTCDSLRRNGFAKINVLPISTIDVHSHGDMTSRLINDADTLAAGLIQGVPKLLTGVTTIVGTLITMFALNAWTALVVVVLTPLSVLVARRITLTSHTLYAEQADAQGALAGFANERIAQRDLISAFGAEKANVASFDLHNESLGKTAYKAQLYGALVNPVTRFVNHLVYIAVGLVGGLLALSGGLTIGQISALLSYANQYTKPFNEISGVIHQIQAADAALARIFALLDYREKLSEPEDAAVFSKALGGVLFRDVAFRYVNDKPLIRDFSLAVMPGQKIAIVGPTGAGKTTLVNLLMRFYDIDAGDIKLDGTSIYRMRRVDLRAQISMVLQDSWVFTGTVRENIAFGKPGATEEEIKNAARRAHADGFISRLPNQYDTVIGESISLSQGQTQLICIARVMLYAPPVLILDEATSSVDTRTEQFVIKAFDDLMRGRTSFVIAHRLSTVRSADSILVMQKGQIVEQGTHQNLLDKRGFYYTMYMSQFGKIDA
ncbi:MAG: ABC transporter ATP-binding protein [Eubacteriales bacterium]|nr:ABC transporter ATP-binding protein [Eubacteriales bacterium]MDD4104239.1 ABC transporter ATP-binding protein [Eubacteriales bacterium]MDD4709944.1 ABC transporter ATP-binding protein [Eubacteriales bacterium]